LNTWFPDILCKIIELQFGNRNDVTYPDSTVQAGSYLFLHPFARRHDRGREVCKYRRNKADMSGEDVASFCTGLRLQRARKGEDMDVVTQWWGRLADNVRLCRARTTFWRMRPSWYLWGPSRSFERAYASPSEKSVCA
jgi:hypothetical protein